VVVVDDKVFGGMSPTKTEEIIDELYTGKKIQELTVAKQIHEPKMETHVEELR